MTLIEVLVAFAILAMVVIGFLGIRTSALVDAAGARDLRIAREIAHQKLSELRAGAVEITPENGVRQVVDDYPLFSYAFFIGESEVARASETFVGDDADRESLDRLEWQRERERLRRAEQRGVSIYEYEDQLIAEEQENQAPSEHEFEEVAIAVYYPVRKLGVDDEEYVFTLRTRISTAALRGLTPERADVVARSMGEEAATTHRHPNAQTPASSADGEGGAGDAPPATTSGGFAGGANGR
jgi:Tfp pilus assembly protein PilV